MNVNTVHDRGCDEDQLMMVSIVVTGTGGVEPVDACTYPLPQATLEVQELQHLPGLFHAVQDSWDLLRGRL